MEHSSQIVAGREKIIAGIGSPLGFFVLALLIVETFLFGAGKAFDLSTETRTEMIWVGVGLFVFVVLVVLILVVWFPKNLVFTEKSHLQMAAIYGAKNNPITSLDFSPSVAVEYSETTRDAQVRKLGKQGDV